MRKVLCLALIVCIAAILGGCSTTHKINKNIGSEDKIAAGHAVYVIVPPDGGYGGRITPGSGQKVGSMLANMLIPYSQGVFMSPSAESLEAAFEKARANNVRYVFQPLIVNWEHRKAAWSSMPTEISVVVMIYDLQKSDPFLPVVNKTVYGQGRTITLNSQFPEEVLHPALSAFVKTLF